MILNKNRAVVFAHYDRDDKVDEYVYYYLKELQKNSDYIVFVSTAKLCRKSINSLKQICSSVIIRENIGYDFVSYKVGLESFEYKSYNEVLICNDSVYGPIYPLDKLLKSIENIQEDFIGITDNYDIEYHLQSYFLMFKKNILVSSAFKEFWDNVKILDDKSQIIKDYEVGLSAHLHKNDFFSYVICSLQPTIYQKISIIIKKLKPKKILNKIVSILSFDLDRKIIAKINPIHYFWKELLLTKKMPFIKIELIRDNPMNVNIDDVETTISKISNYDLGLIKKHIKRLKK